MRSGQLARLSGLSTDTLRTTSVLGSCLRRSERRELPRVSSRPAAARRADSTGFDVGFSLTELKTSIRPRVTLATVPRAVLERLDGGEKVGENMARLMARLCREIERFVAR